jgi:Rieske Fe-S protein
MGNGCEATEDCAGSTGVTETKDATQERCLSRGDAPVPNRGGFVLGFTVMCLLSWLIAAQPALAHPAKGCYLPGSPYSGHWNTEGTDAAQRGNHTGIKSNVHFGQYGGRSGTGDCIRVSSIGVLGSSGAFVEFGWFLGWDTSSNNQYTGSGACVDGQYFGGEPELFVAWAPTNGGYHCKKLFSDGDNVFHYLRISDNDQDTVFKYFEASTQLGTLNVNFTRGDAYTNSERHNAQDDTATAHFKALQETIAGQSTLYDFSNSVEINVPASADDPDFHWQKNSDVETQVVWD